MEALILVVGELVFAILAPFVMLVVELIGSILGLVSSFGTERTTTRIGTSRVARVFGLVLLGVAILVLAAIGFVNSFYFDNSVRYVC